MNTITFNANDYLRECGYSRDKAVDKMFEDVGRLLRILTINGYVTKFYYEDVGIYVLEFDYGDLNLAQNSLVWIPPEAAELRLWEIEEEDQDG